MVGLRAATDAGKGDDALFDGCSGVVPAAQILLLMAEAPGH